jgi:hypothetical protein
MRLRRERPKPRRSSSRLLPQFCLLGLLTAAGWAQETPARVWQDTFAWPTFAEGPADHNPPFDQFRSVDNLPYVYPYTFRIDFKGARAEPQSWRVIYLENEYLKCSILPDVGGHVYSCLDKIANRDIFYANRSFRKNWVGLRGSWAAFGLELNFPIGHSWVSVSPVDFAYSENTADGSASAWVGNVDRVTGMQWRVEFVLRPGRAVLEQRVTLENRSDARHAYYWWSNAAVRLESPQDQFILPTHFTSVHGSGEIDSWPRSTKGPILDVVANYKESAGLFAVGSKEEFLGTYSPSKRAGLIHVAKFDEVPGKKTWTWGPETWPNENLADDNSTYIEIQAGVLPSQEDHEFLHPQERKTFTEYWLPARNLSGISRATVDAVAYVGRPTGAGQILAELNVTRAFPDAVVEIRNGANNESISRETVNLTPAAGWSKRLAAFTGSAILRVLAADGSEILTHTEGKLNAAQPGEIQTGKIPPPAWLTAPKTAADFAERALYNEREAHLDWALFDYGQALALEPASASIRKSRGRLLARLGQFPEAATALAAADAGGDLEARYYAALATRDARKMEGLVSQALASPANAWLASPAAIKAAEWRAATRDHEGALTLIRQADPKLTRAAAIEVAVLRALERWGDANERLASSLATLDPTDLLLRYEAQRVGFCDAPRAAASLSFCNAADFWKHLGSDAERVLNLADHLIRLGQFAEALEVLEAEYPQVLANEMEPDLPAPASHPIIWLYRAYCRQRTGQTFDAELTRAASLPLRYIFPSRLESLEILQGSWASNRTPDANQRYLHGLLLLSMRRTDEAIAILDRLRTERPQLPALHRTLGRAWLDIKGDKVKAREILQEGTQYEPANDELWRALDRARR